MALKVTTNDDEQCALYYNRARKALLRSDVRPSLDLIIAYNCIYDHGRATSQVLISEQFLRRSIEMVIELKLDVDPDDSPWLNHLTPREKEDRRRIFWSSYDLYAWQLSVSPFPLVMNISGNGVKPPRQVYDPHPVFDEAHAYKERCEQKVVLGSIKNHYSTPHPRYTTFFPLREQHPSNFSYTLSNHHFNQATSSTLTTQNSSPHKTKSASLPKYPT
ncbi:hypothetical protein BCR33DRAFT_571403 [Rhizoclosmatium globosum]|uniref:Transcription factor domain-containing protein n=1 Tax=Rhizoclosmatium globosum TaxID=329046 RepID=A0A1Y2B4Y2_9FUNG|nr:hypothetical protein BCR33DRAFT_571403 [Rhizoclosmatium globosum]|eukprot:ORY29888.1 hypothetical protein BCR33DRAFT_571403 [Rhizoclosmatium globosum]